MKQGTEFVCSQKSFVEATEERKQHQIELFLLFIRACEDLEKNFFLKQESRGKLSRDRENRFSSFSQKISRGVREKASIHEQCAGGPINLTSSFFTFRDKAERNDARHF